MRKETSDLGISIRSSNETRMTKRQSLVTIPALALLLMTGGAIAGITTIASAQTATTATQTQGTRPNKGPHVHGTVTAINGTSITITDEHDSATYTIDASAATFKKAAVGAAPTTVTIADIKVGDEVSAMGTLSGTTLAATEVMDGRFGGHGMGGPGGHGRGPGVMGTVTSVNGSTITVKNHDGTVYSVNAGSATVSKMTTGSLSDVVVGDTIGVQGDVSGTSVTAKSIMDDLPTPETAAQTQ